MLTFAAFVSTCAVIYLNRRRVVSLEASIFVSLLGLVSVACFFLQIFGVVLIRGGGIGIIYADEQMFLRVGNIYGLASVSTFVGAFISSLHRFKRVEKDAETVPTHVNGVLTSNPRVIVYFILISSLFFLYYYLNTLSIQINRSGYIWAYNQNGLIRNIHYYIPIVGLIAFYMLINGAKSQMQKFMLFTFVAMSLFSSFSSASRVLGFQILLITFMLILKTKSKNLRFSIFIFGCLLSLFSLSLVVKFRGLPDHGFMPYLRTLIYSPQLISFEMSLVSGSFLLVIPITFLGSQLIPPANMLWAQISPLPSNLSGWNLISDALKLNEFTPSGGVSQIASLGTTSSMFFWIAFGLFLALLGNQYSELGENFKEIRWISLALTLGSFLQFSQYSVRIGTRFLYLSLLVLLAFRVYLRFAKKSNLVET